MRTSVLRVLVLIVPTLACACAVEPGRSFYDDLEGGSDGHVIVGSSGGEAGGSNDANMPPDDATAGEDAALEGAAESGVPEASPDQVAPPEEASVDASAEAGPPEAGPDAPVEAGCGSTSTPLNCGACGAACDTGHSSGAGCSASACTYSGCTLGYKDCDRSTNTADLNGCETQTNTIAACGGCAPCAAATGATAGTLSAMCTGATCLYMCNLGYHDCNANVPPDTDGCETQTNTTAACGGCTPCTASTASTATTLSSSCVASGSGNTCLYTCNTGYYDCNTAAIPDTDGCETHGNTVAACGGCAACAGVSTSVASASCSGTSCQYMCNAGYADCNKNTAPDTDGCETSLTTAANCGACGNVCAGGTCYAHTNGYQAFYDCYAPLTGTTTLATGQAIAFDACTAYTGNRGVCTQYGALTGSGPIVCGTATGTYCHCWSYAGGDRGDTDNGDTSSQCYYPNNGETPLWY